MLKEAVKVGKYFHAKHVKKRNICRRKIEQKDW
jgi:hypothetical protein